MTLPEKPQDLLPLSDARWLAALDEATRIIANGARVFDERQEQYKTGWRATNLHRIAGLLIKAGEVPEPVDPVDEAWKRFHEERRKGGQIREGGQIRATLEKHFHVTPKGDA